MNVQSIKTIFIDYLSTDITQYAILINGSWGSGKTYFWKDTLSNVAKEKKYNAIYISLNGINKIETLEQMLFIKKIPLIGKKENKLIKNSRIILTNIINSTSKSFLKFSINDVFQGISADLFDFSKDVICFDDLERCKLPIDEILGYINNFVEHKSVKIVLLADESKIEYKNIKEKVIGRSVNFELDIKDILPELLVKYKTNNIEFYSFITNQIEFIIDILVDYKEDNLRTISFFFEILEKIFPSIKNIDNQYIQEIILFSAIISIEFKNGRLTSADYKDFKDLENLTRNYYSLSFMQNIRQSDIEDIQNDKPKLYYQTFFETYLNDRSDYYYFYSNIYSFILSGFIDLNELNLEIKKRYPETILPEVQAYQKLVNYNFRKLSDIEFSKLSSEVLNYAEEGRYIIYDYVLIAKFFYFFSEKHLIANSNQEITDILQKGIEISKKRKEINDYTFDNLRHYPDSHPDVIKIYDLVEAAHFEIKNELNYKESNQIINFINQNETDNLSKIFDDNKIIKTVFEYIDGNLLFDSISTTSNDTLTTFTRLLTKRYEISNIGQFLNKDRVCLQTIMYRTRLYLDENNDIKPLQRFLLESLFETLTIACENLDKYK